MQIQSANYVTGVSGYRFDLKTGTFEINRGHDAGGSLPSAPQMINVTAGEWSESDLPRNAVERYKFIGDAVMKIPVEHRDSAEFSTEDISFDRDGSDIRTTLTYRRLETEQEALARTSLRSGLGVTINADGLTITCSGKVMARLGCPKSDEPSVDQSFVVEGDQVYISQALIDQFATKAQIVDEASTRASADEALAGRIGALEKALYRDDESEGALRDALTDWKPGGTVLLSQSLVSAEKFAVTMTRNSHGQYVCTGIGLGIDPTRGETKDDQADMERAIERGDATEILNLIAGQISGAELAQSLRDEIAKAAEPTEAGLGFAACVGPLDFEIIDPIEQIRCVIREELRPGGLLHRR
ncbi:hypothetical protein MXM82_10795 [Pseudomonas asiatica]|uniref:hypothetical protein n=1 Tax=Pseudomonas asiatica TaxID=2219225 RepID=UPI002DBF8994|nr:hypothetical protein [Pseudomonas asiatica]MEB6589618.1 hypothetical protein [Pseudomonas asiatica]